VRGRPPRHDRGALPHRLRRGRPEKRIGGGAGRAAPPSPTPLADRSLTRQKLPHPRARAFGQKISLPPIRCRLRSPLLGARSTDGINRRTPAAGQRPRPQREERKLHGRRLVLFIGLSPVKIFRMQTSPKLFGPVVGSAGMRILPCVCVADVNATAGAASEVFPGEWRGSIDLPWNVGGRWITCPPMLSIHGLKPLRPSSHKLVTGHSTARWLPAAAGLVVIARGSAGCCWRLGRRGRRKTWPRYGTRCTPARGAHGAGRMAALAARPYSRAHCCFGHNATR
jgi:hypothetical protein